jgi:hypothetical protein
MGRKRQAKQGREQSGHAQSVSNTGTTVRSERPVRSDLETILSLPRLVRIFLIVIPTFAVVVILQPVIDAIYLRYFFTMETRNLASLVTAAIALLYFLAGWLLVVGNVGEAPQPRPALRIYLYLSIAVVLLAVLWVGYLYLTNLRLQV